MHTKVHPRSTNKILILGESNSVYSDGWVAGFSDQLQDRFLVENKSVGSTGIFNAIFNLHRIGNEIEQYSAIIIDSSIQDATFYRHNLSFYGELLDELFAYLAKFSGLVCYLQFESLMKAPFEAAFYQYVRQTLEKSDVFFQNFNQAIAENKPHNKIEDLRHAYSDNHHIHRALACDVGRIFAERLVEKINARLVIQTSVPSDSSAAMSGQRFFNVIDFDRLRHREDIDHGRITNAIVDVDTFKISTCGLVIEIEEAMQGEELIGILFNAPSSNGVLRISSESTLYKNFSNNTEQVWGGKLVWARALDNPVKLNAQLELEVLEAVVGFEETAYCSVQHFRAEKQISIEIVGLITKRTGLQRALKIETLLASNSTSLSLSVKQHIAHLFETGQYQTAAHDAERALKLFSKDSFLWKVLGAALLQQGRDTESVIALERGIVLSPKDAELHNTLAAAFQALSNFDRAKAHYLQAIEVSPKYFEAHYNLADMFFSLKGYEDAISYFDSCLVLRRDFPDAITKRAIALHHLARFDEAEESFRAVVLRAPRSFEAHCNLANTLRSKRMFGEAERHYRYALSLNPQYVDALSNLSNLMCETSRYSEADKVSAMALQIQPHHVGALNNRALALRGLNRAEDAVALLRQALKLDASFSEARVNLAYLLLSLGEFAEAWKLHESRQSLTHIRRLISSLRVEAPMWQGEALEGKTLLVWPEQGIGDQIQFIRYVSLLIEKRPRTIFIYCLNAVRHLFATLASPSVVIVNDGEAVPKPDFWVGVLSLPHYCKTELDTIPHQVPYLAASMPLEAYFRRQLSEVEGLKVGVCWSGSAQYKYDTERSLSVALFEMLKVVPKIRFFNLQNNGREFFLNSFGELAYDIGHEIDQYTAPFEESAALMMNLDLVISCDTSIGHLAGALDRPVWLLLPFVADWRWMEAREDSPWYPRTRLFRQDTDRSWETAMKRICGQLLEGASSNKWVTSQAQKVPVTHLNLPVSVGEYFDKLSILKLKTGKIKDTHKLLHVQYELDTLISLMPEIFIGNRDLDTLIEKLDAVNAVIWKVEDDIRAYEQKRDFNGVFIELARAVYLNNDERARIKNQINLLVGSSLIEEKSYV